MKGRTPPPRTADQQRQSERLAALRSGDVAQMRAWAERYGVPLQGDDKTVEISMHESRVIGAALPERLRRESRRWLEQNYPESSVLKRRLP